jgi:hypothetical protein
MDVGRYDSKEGNGRVESGTETESNAGAVTEKAVRVCTGRCAYVQDVRTDISFRISAIPPSVAVV